MPEDTSRFLLVVSDLDGTLLDHHSYEAVEARPALGALQARGVPLVLCSSKTRPEMRAVGRMLATDGPYIAENGGAVVWPRRDEIAQPPGTVADHDEWLLALGATRARLDAAFDRIRQTLELDLVSLVSLSASDLAAMTGLSIEAARYSQAREWSLPFFARSPLSPDQERALAEAAEAHGLTVTRGGRFHHLQGSAGKSEAVDSVRRWFEAEQGARATLVVLGDALNDAGMLASADVAIVVPGHDTAMTRQLCAQVPHARVAASAGPRGWNEAVLEVLATHGPQHRLL